MIHHYVGKLLTTGRLVVIHSDVVPTPGTHGDHYGWVRGPYRTTQEARDIARRGVVTGEVVFRSLGPDEEGFGA